MNSLIARISPHRLDEASPIARTPPRPPHLRQPGYEKDFDFKTLLFDVFYLNNLVALIGPPLRNLGEHVARSQFWLDGKPQPRGPEFFDLVNITEGFLAPPSTQIRKLQFADPSHKEFRGALEIQPSHCDLFAGKRAMMLISKNTHLIWLRDLVEFNVKIHGVNAVLLYDNASTSSSVEDVLETISQVEGVETAVVVPWNFSFGAHGGPAELWDSDFTQYGAIEHARLRFLQTCEGMIYTDADELIVPNTGKSLFETVAASPSGVIGYHSHLIERVNAPDIPLLRFKDLVYAEREPHVVRRWTAVPSRVPLGAQMAVHHVFGHPAQDVSEDFYFRHFFPLTVTPRKLDRLHPVPYEESKHYKDEILIAAMKKVGWL